MHLRRHILLAAALTAVASASVQACPDHTSHAARPAVMSTATGKHGAALVAWKPRAWAPGPASTRQAQGLRVAIDPVDGTMGMPVGELQSQLLIGDDAPVQIDRAADGTLTAHLDERWAEFAMATIGPDGKPGWTCVAGKKGVAQFMKQPLVPVNPATPKWEDK